MLKPMNKGRQLLDNMDTGEIKECMFAIPASGYSDQCCKYCDMRASFDFYFIGRKKEDACHQKNFRPVEEILIRFRENKFDDLLKTGKSR